MELSSSGLRVVNFNQALMKSRAFTGSMDEIRNVEMLALPHVQWFNEHGKQELKQFMVNLDAEQKVTDDTESNKKIYEGIYSILDSICSKIAATKPQLSGELIKMGSTHSHMKINKLDEFDFTYELDIHTILNENARIMPSESKQNRLLLRVDFDEDKPVDVNEFDIEEYPNDPYLDTILSMNGSKDAERYKSIISKHGDSYILNTEAVGLAIFNVLDDVIPSLELPEHWSHGGYNYPHYSGLRMNIPAYLMQFVYHGTDTPLHISVDFAPVLKLPSHIRCKTGDIVDGFLEEHGFIDHQWQRLECGAVKGGYNSLAEKKWLSTYPANSVPKTVVRVCKALHALLKLGTPKYLNKITAKKVAMSHHSRTNDCENVDREMNNYMMFLEHCLCQLKTNNDFATFLDIHEVIGDHDYVSSYIFKRIVMTMMVMDCSQGRLWTLDDIPGLVLSVFMIVNDLIIAVNQTQLLFGNRSEIQSDTEEGEIIEIIPRSHLPELQRTIKPSEIFEQVEISIDKYKCKRRDTVIYERSKEEPKLSESLKWYLSLQEAIKEGKCRSIACLFLRYKFTAKAKLKGLDDGIARVFKFLWCVTVGDSNPLIDIYKQQDPDDDEEEEEIEKYLITRKELDVLLKRKC